jgi:hypothetical protein
MDQVAAPGYTALRMTDPPTGLLWLPNPASHQSWWSRGYGELYVVLLAISSQDWRRSGTTLSVAVSSVTIRSSRRSHSSSAARTSSA